MFDLVFQYYFPILLRAFDRGFRDDRDKGKVVYSRQKTHKKYIAVYKNIHFQIERSYAEVLNVIFFTATYWIMLPHIFFPNLIFLLVLFYKDKILSKNQFR